VKVIRTCPILGFCTWISDAVTAATVPVVPVGAAGVVLGSADCSAVEAAPLPQALTATASTAISPALTPTTRLFIDSSFAA
jgi:hypothetical protein